MEPNVVVVAVEITVSMLHKFDIASKALNHHYATKYPCLCDIMIFGGI